MSLTQVLTPTQLVVGCGVGTGRVTLVEGGLLVLDKCLLVGDEDKGIEDNFVVVVERGFVVALEEGNFVEVESRVVTVDEGTGVVGCGDPPVIKFLIARS
jgi:hypothetical protein